MHIIESTSDLTSYYSLFKPISFSNPVGKVLYEIIINSFILPCSLSSMPMPVCLLGISMYLCPGRYRVFVVMCLWFVSSMLTAQSAVLSPFVTFLVRSKQNKNWAESLRSQIISHWSILFGLSVR